MMRVKASEPVLIRPERIRTVMQMHNHPDRRIAALQVEVLAARQEIARLQLRLREGKRRAARKRRERRA